MGSDRFLARSNSSLHGSTAPSRRPRAGPPIATRPAWIRWLSRGQLDVIQAATGVSSSVVEALTLNVYDGTALQLDPNSHRLDASFSFGALSRSRFCPECIRESDGRWQLAWRLGWSFVCVVQNCFTRRRLPNVWELPTAATGLPSRSYACIVRVR